MAGSNNEIPNEESDEVIYKLVWWEEDGKTSVARGQKFWIDTASSLLHFDGNHGEIILPTKTIKFVLKQETGQWARREKEF